MNELFFCAFMTGISCVSVGVAPFLRDRRNPLSIAFFASSCAMACWNVCLAVSIIFGDPLHSLAILLMHLGVIWTPIFYTHFIHIFLQIQKNLAVWILYFVGAFLTVTALFIPHSNGNPEVFYPKDLANFQLFTVSVVLFAVIFIRNFWILFSHNRVSTGIKKIQIKYILLATSLGFIGFSSNFLPIYNLWLYPFTPYANLLIVVYLAIIGYAILTFRLFDFSLVTRWGLAYSFLVISAFLIVLLIYNAMTRLGTPKHVLILGIACTIVFCFDFLKRKINQFVDHFIFHSPDLQQILSGIHESLGGHDGRKELTSKIADELKKIWKVSHAGLILWDSKTDCFQPFPEQEFATQLISQTQQPILRTDFLVRTLETERRLFKFGILTQEEITSMASKLPPGSKTTFWKIRRTMKWLGADICVPLMSKTQQLAGFIVLGEKADKSVFNSEDRKFLSHIAEIISTQEAKFS